MQIIQNIPLSSPQKYLSAALLGLLATWLLMGPAMAAFGADHWLSGSLLSAGGVLAFVASLGLILSLEFDTYSPSTSLMSTTAISEQRFAEAQAFEASYWNVRRADHIGMIQDIESSHRLALHMQWAGYLNRRYNRLLDIGCGALGLGILWMVDAKERVGLDPLKVVPATSGVAVIDRFVAEAQQQCTYVQSQGEGLPFESQSFDCIACNNVLDHVQNPEAILREAKRCLSGVGIFAFAVDTHSLLGVGVRKVLKRVAPNHGSLQGHPFEWTDRQVSALLRRHGFRILSHNDRPLKGLLVGGVCRSTWILTHA